MSDNDQEGPIRRIAKIVWQAINRCAATVGILKLNRYERLCNSPGGPMGPNTLEVHLAETELPADPAMLFLALLQAAATDPVSRQYAFQLAGSVELARAATPESLNRLVTLLTYLTAQAKAGAFL